MTESESRIINGKEIVLYREIETGLYRFSKDAVDLLLKSLEENEQYKAIGTIEELKDLKEKNTPMELAEHNFQDEVHHYLCPSCRNIVSFNQNYCEECGQALEN